MEMNKINHVIYQKMSSSVSSQVPNSKKQMKAWGCRLSAIIYFFFWGVWNLWWNMKHKFLISFLKKQYRFIQGHIFGIFLLKCCYSHNLLYFVIWYYNMTVRTQSVQKPVVEEEDLSDRTIPTSVKYKNKWAATIFNKINGNCVKGSSTFIGFQKHV